MSCPAGSARYADCLIRAARIYPFSGTPAEHADAVAIAGGRVLAVGAHKEMSALAGPGTRLIDDPGLVLLPAFHDTHNHQLETGASLDLVQLGGADSIEQLLDRIREQARSAAPGEWIVASGSWHESSLREQRLPTAAELERASPRHPVTVWRGGHVAVVNSTALKLAGINAATPDPDGGTIVRDHTGNPTGVLIEAGALAPVQALLPTLDAASRIHALIRAGRAYTARGIGAVRDPALSLGDLAAYQRAEAQGLLSVRTRGLLLVPEVGGIDAAISHIGRGREAAGAGTDMFRMTGIKVIVDGGIEGAALTSAYATDAGYHGHLLYDQAELGALVDCAVAHHWHVACHVVGDRALDLVLDVFESALMRYPASRPLTMTIEHGILAAPGQRKRAARLGVGFAVQYPLLYALAANMIRYWGEERAHQALPLRALIEDGVEIAADSDSYVAPFDPLLAIWGMVTRQTRMSGVLGPEHAIDRETAFRLYTSAASTFVGEDSVRGSLTPGHKADIVAFTQDPLHCDLDALPSLEPLFTMVDGKVVYERTSP